VTKLRIAGFVFLSLLTTTSSVYAQSFVGLETKFVDGVAVPLVDGQIEKTWPTSVEGGSLGLFTWFLSNDIGHRDSRWSEIYLGPAWYPRKWLEIVVGAGVETDLHPWRIGGEVIAAGQHGFMIFAWEQGGSGPWYLLKYLHPVAGKFSAGVFSRRFAGTGPLLSVKLNGRYSIWATAGPDLENGRVKTVLGLNVGIP
jgi:hypothetical protein